MSNQLANSAQTTITATAALIVATALTLVPNTSHAAQCSARSPTFTVALVELYTSEGCSSCPPADQWLSKLRKAQPNAAVLPLSLHVNYWDYIGWKDPFAQQKFTDRQRVLSRLQGASGVYTPQVVLSAGDYREWWDEKTFAQDVAKINRQPAAALIDIEAADSASPGQLRVTGKAKTAVTEPAELYLAVFENGISNHVARGENAGATLKHEHVVRQWIGPIPIKDGQASVDETIKISTTNKLAASGSGASGSGATGANPFGLAAFVQTKSGKVLQAIGCDLR